MLRYHKEVYIDPKDIDRLRAFNNKLNYLDWQYTNHCLDNIKHRIIDLEGLLKFIKDLELRAENIFEFYSDNISREIIKVCYRINWQKETDIILIIGEDKQIITIYINSREDNHETLRKGLYING